MKISDKAIKIADQRAKEKKNYYFCIDNYVCPECASDLMTKSPKYNSFMTYFGRHTCSNKKCNFTHLIF